ncbi:alpha/beta fold hydrolase [Williamsia phyllosphaerae]|uniref:Alpha/beta hydrolase n=1 Tax=Williamsia phyllosphaerae TaxID=885042 RepID=A0ABQ1U5T2_9NOCA|nr:alpha/beta hydrolase [Williamsia phyllosphaerae]GGF08988.1 alpha/beta hydrolase [Williamsia phyllosphaerae]
MAASTPVIFVHGLWLHSSTWKPWIDLFSAEDIPASAPGWPREHSSVFKCRQRGEDVVGMGIAEVATHYSRIAAEFDSPPVVVGHSHGGLVAEYLLARGLASAAVAIDPARLSEELPQPISQLIAEYPAMANPANRGREVNLNNRQFRSVFGNAIGEDESDSLYERWTIPASGALLFETDFAGSEPPAADDPARGPLLLVSSGRGQDADDAAPTSSFESYRHADAVTERRVFADRGHSLVIDNGWSDVAKSVLEWVTARSDRG